MDSTSRICPYPRPYPHFKSASRYPQQSSLVSNAKTRFFARDWRAVKLCFLWKLRFGHAPPLPSFLPKSCRRYDAIVKNAALRLGAPFQERPASCIPVTAGLFYSMTGQFLPNSDAHALKETKVDRNIVPARLPDLKRIPKIPDFGPPTEEELHATRRDDEINIDIPD
ncbi:hypothetical protein Y046_6076 [Burkholderia pseudomallei MSHR2990]|nr:hypothetical protein Y046_6076 [Burkholderia pseudomallei MSHR2990]